MKEIWKDIKDYEGLYQISNLGRIKSLSRILVAPSGAEYMSKEKILKGSIRLNGNQRTNIVQFPDFKDKNGKWHHKSFLVNRLVAENFLGMERNCKLNVYHIDGNTLNNCVINLRIGTEKEKTQQAIKNGLFEIRKKRRKEKMSKITEDEKYKNKLRRRIKSINTEIENTNLYCAGIRKRHNYEIYIYKDDKYLYLGSEKQLNKAKQRRIKELEKYKSILERKLNEKT